MSALRTKKGSLMDLRRVHVGSRVALVAAAGCAALAAAAMTARATAVAFCDASAYRLSLRSLTGANGTGTALVIRITARTAACELPATLGDVRVTIGSRIVEVREVPAPGAVAIVRLVRVPRLQRVAVPIAFGP